MIVIAVMGRSQPKTFATHSSCVPACRTVAADKGVSARSSVLASVITHSRVPSRQAPSGSARSSGRTDSNPSSSPSRLRPSSKLDAPESPSSEATASKCASKREPRIPRSRNTRVARSPRPIATTSAASVTGSVIQCGVQLIAFAHPSASRWRSRARSRQVSGSWRDSCHAHDAVK